MESNSPQRQALAKSFLESAEPIEKLTIEQLKKAQDEQKLIIEKINLLTDALAQIENELPPANLYETTDRINKLCSRIEFCRVRINRVNKRAENMLNSLNRPKIQMKVPHPQQASVAKPPSYT